MWRILFIFLLLVEFVGIMLFVIPGGPTNLWGRKAARLWGDKPFGFSTPENFLALEEMVGRHVVVVAANGCLMVSTITVSVEESQLPEDLGYSIEPSGVSPISMLGPVMGLGAILFVAAVVYCVRVCVYKDGHCDKCGYSLKGLVEPRCPECGTEFVVDVGMIDKQCASSSEDSSALSGAGEK